MSFKSMMNCALSVIVGLMYAVEVGAHPEELIPVIIESNTDQSPPIATDKSGRPLWEIDAGVPFIGSPAHERMTIASLTISNIYARPYNAKTNEAYIHGVFWNDDPEDLLCPECSWYNPRKFDKRWGLAFAARFSAAKEFVRNGDRNHDAVSYLVGDGLLERSHFGDLQFLHSMAAHNGETAAETQAKMLAWAEFVYKVSVGEIPQKTKMREIPIQRIRDLFISDIRLSEVAIEALFKGRVFARRAAMGSLLHMVQDSYALGHADRKILDNTTATGKVFARGSILEFHCYTDQDEKLHAEDDKWPIGLDDRSPIGSHNPIAVGVKLLKYMNSATPWKEVEEYLRDTVFAIDYPDKSAGPGDRYRKSDGKLRP